MPEDEMLERVATHIQRANRHGQDLEQFITDIASKEVTAAVQAERVRIADDLKATFRPVRGSNLANYINKLREGK